MDDATLVAGWDHVEGRSRRLRVMPLFAALALAFALVVLIQTRAEAQINFGQVFCSAVLAVFNAFQNSPFFGFIRGILTSLLNFFGCVISG